MSEPIADVFRYCPQCGAASTTLGANPLRCAACRYTHFFSPIAAVGAIVTDVDERVLLITRAREPGKGKFGLPGGFVDAGETLEQACAREVMEETNLRATSLTYLTSFPNSYDYRGVVINVTDSFFVCDVASLDSIRAQDGEVSAYCFVHLEEQHLRSMAFHSNRQALEFYLSTKAKRS